MDAFYINLDRRPDRRAAIEADFLAKAPPTWRLTRFAAIEGAAPPGIVSPAEKSCFLSHRRVIEQRLGVAAPTMILEDDAAFGARSFGVIDAQLAAAPDDRWDVIFTDLCIPEIMPMAQLYRLRRDLTRDGAAGVNLIHLGRFNFAAATAYIINPRSCARLCELFLERPAIDQPFDLFLRDLIRGGRLKGLAIFPFPTTLSPLAETSSIQASATSATDRIWNLFRRAVWLERDLSALEDEIAFIKSQLVDDDADLIASIIAAQLSDGFRLK